MRGKSLGEQTLTSLWHLQLYEMGRAKPSVVNLRVECYVSIIIE